MSEVLYDLLCLLWLFGAVAVGWFAWEATHRSRAVVNAFTYYVLGCIGFLMLWYLNPLLAIGGVAALVFRKVWPVVAAARAYRERVAARKAHAERILR